MRFLRALSTADSEPAAGESIMLSYLTFSQRNSERIRANVSYIPASHPFPVSQKRKEAYEEGGLLPCPMDDPEGWFAFPTFTIYGMTNVDGNPRHTKADCTVRILLLDCVDCRVDGYRSYIYRNL